MKLLKKTVNDKLITNLDKIDISGFVLKNKYDTYKSDLKEKISDADKKIPKISDLVKKTDYDAKISVTEKIFITTADYNRFIKYFLSN